jgi:CRP-like cAMP-binding protein
MHRVSLAPGETLYREGDEPQSAYLVLSGEVAMERRGIKVIAGQGALIGFSHLVQQAYRSTCTAIGDVTLLAFTRKELNGIVRSNPDQAMAIIEGLIQLSAQIVDAMEARQGG